MSPASRDMETRNLGDIGVSQPQGDGLRRTHAMTGLQDTGYRIQDTEWGRLRTRLGKGKGMDLGPASFTVTLVLVHEPAPRRNSDGRASLDGFPA